MKRRGFSIFEWLVALFVASLILVVVMRLYDAGQTTYETVSVQNTAYTRARFAVDTIADHVRNAQRCTSGGVIHSAVHAASPTSIEYYTDDVGSTVRYHLSNGNLVRTQNGTDTVVVPNVSALSLTYYVSNTYNGAVTFTAGPTPTNYELTLLSVIGITATVSTDGYTGSYTTTVRLRNSPRKTRLSGG